MPEIFQQAIVDQIIDISQQDAEISMKYLSQINGLFVGVSAGANVCIAKKIAGELQISGATEPLGDFEITLALTK